MNTTFSVRPEESSILIRAIKNSGGRVQRMKKFEGSYSVSFMKKKEMPENYFKGSIFAKLPKVGQKDLFESMETIKALSAAGKFRNYKFTYEDFLRA